MGAGRDCMLGVSVGMGDTPPAQEYGGGCRAREILPTLPSLASG